MRAQDQATIYLLASQALKSDDPSIRRPAIATLIDLAQHAIPSVRACANAALAKEFGPYAVSDGLSGCVAPISTVHRCDAEDWDCHGCEWLWNPPHDSGPDPASKNGVMADRIETAMCTGRMQCCLKAAHSHSNVAGSARR